MLTPRPRVTATTTATATGDPSGTPSPNGSPVPTGTRRPREDFVVAIEPGVAPTVLDSIASWLDENEPSLTLDVETPSEAPNAALAITGEDPGGGRPLAPTYWIALANVTSQVEGIDSSFVADALAGDADWSSVEYGQAGAVSFYVEQSTAEGLAAVLGVDTGTLAEHAEVLPADDLLEALLGDADGLAVLPLDMVDPRGRSLAVDGVDVIREIGDAADYPLVSTAYVTTNGAAGSVAARLADALADAPSPLEPLIDVLAVGDLIPARCVLARINEAGPDYRLPFRQIRDKIQSADLAYGTLDMQFVDGLDHNLCFENYEHTAPTAMAEAIAWAGFDLIMNATNHSLDGVFRAGKRAYAENHQAFVDNNVVHIGQGETYEDAAKTASIEVKGVKFGFTAADGVSSFTWANETEGGTMPADPDVVREQVTELKQDNDVVIATCECGIVDGDAEYRRLPTDLQVAMANAALESGASQYVGGQSHWVQGADFRGKQFVGYHMGNFVYDQDWSYETMHGAILDSYYIGSRLVNIRYSIVVIENMCCPRLIEDRAEAKITLDEIWKATPGVPGSEIP